MTKRIFKYRLDHWGGEPVSPTLLPIGARFLYADFQHGKIFVWFEVDIAFAKIERTLYYLMTGDDVHGVYLGSCQRSDENLSVGYFVVHIYEEVNQHYVEPEGK